MNEDKRLLRRLERKRAVFRRRDVCRAEAVPRRRTGRIELSEEHARREEVHERTLEARRIEGAVLQKRKKVVVGPVGAEVEPRVERGKARLGLRIAPVVPEVDVAHCADIAYNVPLEAPLAAQDVRQQPSARAARNAAHCAVGAHHAFDMRVLHKRTERLKVVFGEVAVRRPRVEL